MSEINTYLEIVRKLAPFDRVINIFPLKNMVGYIFQTGLPGLHNDIFSMQSHAVLLTYMHGQFLNLKAITLIIYINFLL